jgi:hypothetical protein
MSTVIVKNIYAEQLIEWFYNSVIADGGDGAAVICCGNPSETADFFIRWWKENHLPDMKRGGYKLDEFYHPKEVYLGFDGETIINYHDLNENFMFSDKKMELHHGDISFFVEEDCVSGHDITNPFKCLKVRE